MSVGLSDLWSFAFMNVIVHVVLQFAVFLFFKLIASSLFNFIISETIPEHKGCLEAFLQ